MIRHTTPSIKVYMIYLYYKYTVFLQKKQA